MESLEYFDTYTSYNLKLFPYELTKCKKLKDRKLNTKVLFDNFKNRKTFLSELAKQILLDLYLKSIYFTENKNLKNM
ncbi:hypothetical protein DS884_02445 [Tenacibaculum sp. E3R01]|uniref:hypothetical protein n=1 Tax=Tenacibaculum sp. MAR_2010_89 TaxID=1250198 RepID=UPI00089C4BC8|nr:hypothetical protein [Tenacibaculum sp. MAR_2010_89]RBW62480.1 hypothetical protein DS884_02445 [Tenacibaculum sp. E3R01]SEE34602.1 hypothetical protein SAMN04487765_2217 [Tenacibaculum sp. MAR_2010_89]